MWWKTSSFLSQRLWSCIDLVDTFAQRKKSGERCSTWRMAFISNEYVAFPIAVMCRFMGVSTSGSYASQCRPVSPRAMRDAALSFQIVASHEASKQTYRSPQIRVDLIGKGERVGCSACKRIETNRAARESRAWRADFSGGTQTRGASGRIALPRLAEVPSDHVWIRRGPASPQTAPERS